LSRKIFGTDYKSAPADGKEITTAENPYLYLENKAGKTVEIAVNSNPLAEKAVEVLLQELKENPVRKVTVPASPYRSKWHEE
jgi:hypothetical protein